MAVWPVEAAPGVTVESLEPVFALAGTVDLLLVGCGTTFGPEPAGLRSALKEAGIGLEWMDTGGACRTYNVLLSEDRRVAAALIAVD